MRTEHKWAVVVALIAIAALVYILNIYSGSNQQPSELPFENRPATTGTTPAGPRTSGTPAPAGGTRESGRSVFNNTPPAQPSGTSRGGLPPAPPTDARSSDSRSAGLPPLRGNTGATPGTGSPGMAVTPGSNAPATSNPPAVTTPPTRTADSASPFAPRSGGTSESPRLPDRLAGGAVDPTVILPDPTPTPRGNVLTPPRRVDPDEMADATPAPRVTARETPSPRTTPGVPPPPPAEGGAPQSDLAALVNPSGAPAGTGTYTIREADTLSAIAREVYGEERYWKAIVAANPGLDPNRLFVGKTIILPPKDTVLAGKSTKPAPAKSNAGRSEEQAASGGSTADARGARSRSNAEPAAERRGGGERVAGTTVREDGDKVKAGRATYRVGSGDSLISIARNVLKDENRWREIYELNKDRLKSPDVLPAGVELRMPEVKPDRGGAAKGKG